MATITSVKEKIQGLIDKANERTGGNATDLTSAIDTLVTGYGQGGSSADVVTVSFYNYDGTWLYDKPIIKGDDCIDVIAKGLLDTPTKESDNYYNYAFSGWSKANDNTVDSGVLNAISEDVNLYACYTSSTRYYTVNFYSDEVLEDTVQVTYGQTASHKELIKDGYKIGGYEPSNENITSDVDINIQWILDDGLIHDDWDTIASYCDDGSYATRYKVGDRKALDITYADGTSETIPMRVVQLDSTYDRHTDDKTKYAKLVFIADNLLKDSVNKKFTTTDAVYWNQTDLYEHLNGEFLTYLPQTLQNVLVDVGAGSISSISDANKKGKVWIPSVKEMWNYTYSSGNFYLLDWGTGAQYTEYSSEIVSTSQYTARRFTKVGSDTVEERWFRNSYRHGAVASMTGHIYDGGQSSMSPVFKYVSRDSQSWASSKKAVLIGFCIG